MKSILRKYAPTIIVATVFIAFFFFFGLTCPLRYLTGIACPCCGMTRALLSVAKLDFRGYFRYNVMAIFVLSDVLLLMMQKRIKRKKALYTYLITTLSLNLFYYLFRLHSGTIL